MKTSNAFRVTCFAGLAVACSSTPPPTTEPPKCDQQMVSSAVITSPHINPSPAGEARPVQVRLYQLKTDTRFLNASFDQIWKNDADVLQDDLVKADEFPAYPNTRTDVKFERDEAAQFFMVAALFRTPKGRNWFTSFEFPPSPANGDGCGMPAADCPDGECPAEGGPVANPKFYVWIEDTRVEDGIEHADDFPEGRTQSFKAGGSGTGDAAKPAKPGAAPSARDRAEGAVDKASDTKDAVDSATDVSVPRAPSAPKAPKGPSAPGGLP